jgi:uncharacterized repeat protein (TIGR01451 family)
MIKRGFKWQRPGRLGLLAIAVGLVAIGLIATVALGALVTDTGTYSVEVTDKTQSSPLVTLSPGGAKVMYIGSSAQNQASGTGLFDPFVRLQADTTERGYNTDGTTEFDTKTGTWTHAIKVSAIPVVDCDGSGPGTATCFELFVDINDNNSTSYISLTDVEIYFANGPGAATLTGYPFSSPPAGTTVTKEYDFSGEIKIHDVNQGSGRGDLEYLVPTAGHPFTSSTYFVLFSKWGSGDAAPDGKTYASDGGFEEWKVRKVPNVTIVKTANPVGPVNAGGTIGFDITVSNTGAADATNVTITDPLPAGAGTDLNWSLNPAFSGCSISGSVGSQVLNCSFATLAAGASIGPIHIQSGTTAADCAVVSNTATAASGNDGGGSSTGSVTVQCGALKILKNSTKGHAVKVAGAVFSVSGHANVTDNGTGDEDNTIGVVCVSGLTPGTHTVNEVSAPNGYGSGATQTDQSVTVANGTNCTSSLPGAAATATFTNPPLADIQVRFRDGGSGDTALGSAGITCNNATGTPDDNNTTGWNNTHTVTGVKVTSSSITITCDIHIDP